MSYAAAAAAIDAAETIGITTHIGPDGDGIGAALALRLALQARGKRVRLVFPSEVSQIYAWLPGFARIETVEDTAAARRRRPVEVLISCDCGDLGRLGAVAEHRCGQLVNLDHHASNTRFGAVNVVDLKAASTTVVVDKVLKRLGVALTPAIAECLYTGLVFDTGRFMHSNTTAGVLRIAARWLATGLDAASVNRRLEYCQTEADLRWQAAAIAKLTVDPDDSRIAGVAFAAADLSGQAMPEDWSALVEIPRRLAGVEIAYLLREQPDGTVRASLRSNPPYAIGPVAVANGGGGHDQAAGCSLHGGLAAAQSALLPALRAALG